MNFMEAYPLLAQISGEQWQLWRESLMREIGDDEEKARSYLPMWLKKNSKTHAIPEFWVELADLEWARHFVRTAEMASPSATAKLSINPVMRILKLTYEIRAWIKNPLAQPAKRQHILIITPSNELEATIEMAAILDELSDEPVDQSQLVASLKLKHGNRPWDSAIRDMVRASILLGASSV